MDDSTVIFLGLMVAILVVSGIAAVWRIRRFSAQRAEAERRAASAFEAMHHASRQLKNTQQTDAIDARLTPGERLLRRYGGARDRGANKPRGGGA